MGLKMTTATEKLEKIANFDTFFKIWIRACQADGITDEQIVNDLQRLVKLVEVDKETKKHIMEGVQ